MTPYPRHFHVVFDVASCLLNPSNYNFLVVCSFCAYIYSEEFAFFSERCPSQIYCAYIGLSERHKKIYGSNETKKIPR